MYTDFTINEDELGLYTLHATSHSRSIKDKHLEKTELSKYYKITIG